MENSQENRKTLKARDIFEEIEGQGYKSKYNIHYHVTPNEMKTIGKSIVDYENKIQMFKIMDLVDYDANIICDMKGDNLMLVGIEIRYIFSHVSMMS